MANKDDTRNENNTCNKHNTCDEKYTCNTDSPFFCGDRCGNSVQVIYSRLLGITNFMLEDPDNVVLKRFEDLHILHLVSLQHRLMDCSHEIKEYAKFGDQSLMDEVFIKLGDLLRNYDDAIDRYVRMQARLSTPQYALRSLRGKNDRKTQPLGTAWNDEFDSEDTNLDLVSIASRSDKGAIHKFIDGKTWLQRLFPQIRPSNPAVDVEKGQPEPQQKGDTRNHFYYSEDAVRMFENVILSILFCGLIMIPISVLPLLTHRLSRILLSFGCVALAFLSFCMLSRQTQKSNLAAMLTYATVLTAFLTNSI